MVKIFAAVVAIYCFASVGVEVMKDTQGTDRMQANVPKICLLLALGVFALYILGWE